MDKPVLVRVGDRVWYGMRDSPKEGYPKPDRYINKENSWRVKEEANVAASLERPDHPWNWAGVCVGVCYLLRTRQIPLSAELIQKIPPEWREEVIKHAFLGIIGASS